MRIALAAFASLALLAGVSADAQNWPGKPVRLVVPYPPGGNVDTAARIVAPGLQEVLGQPFVIENKAGAGGMIAGEYVAKSTPDGYTLFFTANSPLLHAPIIFNRPAYQWDKDFAAIGSVSFTPIVLQVHPSVAAGSVKELVALARAQPGKLGMGTPSAGTTNHLLSELLQASAGVSWLTVHYKGNAPATTALLAGEIQLNFDQVSVALQYIRTGRTRAIAVASEKRVHWLPDTPTFAEEGLAGVVGETFTGIVAPAATPPAVVATLSAALARVVGDKAVAEKFLGIGAEARPMTPEAFSAFLRREYDKWTPIIRSAGVSAK